MEAVPGSVKSKADGDRKAWAYVRSAAKVECEDRSGNASFAPVTPVRQSRREKTEEQPAIFEGALVVEVWRKREKSWRDDERRDCGIVPDSQACEISSKYAVGARH